MHTRKQRSHYGFITLLCFIAMLFIMGLNYASAADQIMTGKIASVTQKVTKNGDPYTIIVLPENKTLNGIAYTTETSVFCFKSPEAKNFKAGDPVKLIAKRTISKDGNEFVTLVQFVK